MHVSPTSDLNVSFDEGRLEIAFNRPACRNLINYEMLEALSATCRAAQNDPAVRVVVLRGEGDDFSAGDDFDDMGEWPERFAHRRPGGGHGPAPLPEQDAIRALRALMKPSIAVIRGQALGLALDLAAVCDVRIAARSAEIGDPRIHQGRAASTGISYVLPRLIGQSQATRIMLLGETLNADEALRIHLLHRVVDDDVFDDSAAALVREIVALPTRSWEVHKKQVIPQLDLGFEAAMTHCLGIRQTHVIEDIVEGRLAFRERRDPHFTGR
ncbi:MAG: enoyl-CoA hydratase-related protein [Gammaproteobacteria bacterium]|nr:enoyl-CoA hydratase-related protein [Gammaproteobacteria bacterium]